METRIWIAVILIIAIVAAAIGYVVKPSPPELAELQDRVSQLEAELEAKLVKAGFVYVGPIEDYGWTMAHDRGRTRVDEKYDWLTTTYAEIVPEAEVADYIDEMFQGGADVVFTASFGYGWDTVTAGGRWPDKILYHCSGDPSIHGTAPNVGFYFAGPGL